MNALEYPTHGYQANSLLDPSRATTNVNARHDDIFGRYHLVYPRFNARSSGSSTGCPDRWEELMNLPGGTLTGRGSGSWKMSSLTRETASEQEEEHWHEYASVPHNTPTSEGTTGCTETTISSDYDGRHTSPQQSSQAERLARTSDDKDRAEMRHDTCVSLFASIGLTTGVIGGAIGASTVKSKKLASYAHKGKTLGLLGVIKGVKSGSSIWESTLWKSLSCQTDLTDSDDNATSRSQSWLGWGGSLAWNTAVRIGGGISMAFWETYSYLRDTAVSAYSQVPSIYRRWYEVGDAERSTGEYSLVDHREQQTKLLLDVHDLAEVRTSLPDENGDQKCNASVFEDDPYA